MVRRFQKTIWLLCAFLLLSQSLLPVSAQAYVTVRCVGASANSPDCVRTLVPVEESISGRSYRAPMACCAHMTRMWAMGHGISTEASVYPAVVSSLPCLVTVSPLSTERSTATQSARSWMLDLSPAHAPPTATAVLLGTMNAISLSLDSFSLPKLALSPSHGLRAPPTS